jgi:hypothetical protein
MFSGGMFPAMPTTSAPRCWMRPMTGEAALVAVLLLLFIWAHPAKNSSRDANTITHFFIFIFVILLFLYVHLLIFL